jgi:hypothetical protein
MTEDRLQIVQRTDKWITDYRQQIIEGRWDAGCGSQNKGYGVQDIDSDNSA